MNTPAHLIFGLTAFGRAGQPSRNVAALAGALAPDLSLYLLTGWALAVQGHSAGYVFNTLYFSAAWQSVFAVDNSVFVWGAVLGLGAAVRSSVVMVFAAAALLHIGLDLPVHHDDGRPHFWPLSDWVFESPISYWDTRHHGRIVGGAESLAALVCLALLWRRHRATVARALLAGAAIMTAAPGMLWAVVF